MRVSGVLKARGRNHHCRPSSGHLPFRGLTGLISEGEIASRPVRTPAAPTSDAESKAASLGKSFVSSSVRFQRLAIDDADFIKSVANATPPKPAGLLGEALCFNFALDRCEVFKYPQPRKRTGALSDER